MKSHSGFFEQIKKSIMFFVGIFAGSEPKIQKVVQFNFDFFFEKVYL